LAKTKQLVADFAFCVSNHSKVVCSVHLNYGKNIVLTVLSLNKSDTFSLHILRSDLGFWKDMDKQSCKSCRPYHIMCIIGLKLQKWFYEFRIKMCAW